MASGMSVGLVKTVWKAIKELNPETVKQESQHRLSIGIVGTEAEMNAIMAWLTQGQGIGRAGGMVLRFDSQTVRSLDKPAKQCNIVVCASDCTAEELGVPDYRLFYWDSANPEDTVNAILDEDRLSGLHLALAHWFKVFRKNTNSRIIRATSMENAAFVASTAIGNIIPNPLAPLASVAEAAGDTVVLTANQVRMLFRLAAANDKPIGYRELMPQIGSIIAAAFGWRALARQLIGKMPLGAGLAAKSAVSYAGTWTIGEGMLLYFTTGRKMTKKETQERFQDVMGEARQVAAQIVNSLSQKVRVLRKPAG